MSDQGAKMEDAHKSLAEAVGLLSLALVKRRISPRMLDRIRRLAQAGLDALPK